MWTDCEEMVPLLKQVTEERKERSNIFDTKIVAGSNAGSRPVYEAKTH